MVLTNSNGDLDTIGCPKGVIWLWNGSIENLPNGWKLCDGQEGRPDLRGKFVLGVNTGSNKYNNLSERIMGSSGGSETHNHRYFDTQWSENINSLNNQGFGYGEINPFTGRTDGNRIGSGPIDTDNTLVGDFRYTGPGLEQTEKGVNNGKIMPPFYTLAYIIKVV